MGSLTQLWEMTNKLSQAREKDFIKVKILNNKKVILTKIKVK